MASILARFRTWFAEYDATVWYRQLEQDVAAGRLDKFAREALRDHKAGRAPSCEARANPRFRRCYRGLPKKIQELHLMRADTSAPSEGGVT